MKTIINQFQLYRQYNSFLFITAYVWGLFLFSLFICLASFIPLATSSALVVPNLFNFLLLFIERDPSFSINPLKFFQQRKTFKTKFALLFQDNVTFILNYLNSIENEKIISDKEKEEIQQIKDYIRTDEKSLKEIVNYICDKESFFDKINEKIQLFEHIKPSLKITHNDIEKLF